MFLGSRHYKANCQNASKRLGRKMKVSTERACIWQSEKPLSASMAAGAHYYYEREREDENDNETKERDAS